MTIELNKSLSHIDNFRSHRIRFLRLGTAFLIDCHILKTAPARNVVLVVIVIQVCQFRLSEVAVTIPGRLVNLLG